MLTYILRPADFIDVKARWPDNSNSPRLIAFARRQDCEDLVCFELAEDREASMFDRERAFAMNQDRLASQAAIYARAY